MIQNTTMPRIIKMVSNYQPNVEQQGASKQNLIRPETCYIDTQYKLKCTKSTSQQPEK